MTATTDQPFTQDAEFGLMELDLLGTYAGRRFPFPLRVPSSGRIEGERKALLASAGEALAERGLASERGPEGAAAELVDALRGHRASMDLVVVGQGSVMGTVAMIRGSRAVVCRQRISGTPGPVTVTPVAADALTDEFANRIPKVKAAAAMPITFPPGVVGDATRLLENTGGRSAPWKPVRAMVRERGGDEGAVDALVNLLPSVSGRGQLGVLVHGGSGTVERVLELSWVDSPYGRVRIGLDTYGWVSINPLRHSELVRMLRGAAMVARAAKTRR